MSNCFARQPIFNSRVEIYGYELLFRESAEHFAYTSIDGDQASSSTIMNAFHDIGIERVTNGKKAFVNFTERLLLDSVATILPKKVLVVELLEDIRPTEAVLDACRKLKKAGYMIALDDYVLTQENFAFLAVADIVKIDFLNNPMEQIKKFAAGFKNSKIQLLAEKVETHEEFVAAKESGFGLFQGFFFSKPMIMKASDKIGPLKLNCLRLIRLAHEEEVDYNKIEAVVKHDVALTYKLLRAVNSAFFGVRFTVKNIKQALAILGIEEIKKWITLISLAVLNENKPNELMRLALVRARFLELIGAHAGYEDCVDDLFLVGLLSLMDAIMDLPMSEIIRQTNIASNIMEPLTTGGGPYGNIFRMILHYEKSEWDECLAIAEEFKLDFDILGSSYYDAVEWASQLRIH